MINILIKSLEIDIVYAVNSLIYSLRNLPILKDLLTDDAYDSKVLKIVIGIIGIVLSGIHHCQPSAPTCACPQRAMPAFALCSPVQYQNHYGRLHL